MKFKLGTERPGMLLVSLFYAVVGVVLAVILALSRFEPPHVGVLVVLNLMVSYGLFKMKKWSVKLLAALFFLQFTVGIITLYSVLGWTSSPFWETAALELPLIVYVVLCVVSFAYVVAKRKDFE